jgi:hypothetical protein
MPTRPRTGIVGGFPELARQTSRPVSRRPERGSVHEGWLWALRSDHPSLTESAAMADALLDKRGKSTSTIVALFTEGFRTAFMFGWRRRAEPADGLRKNRISQRRPRRPRPTPFWIHTSRFRLRRANCDPVPNPDPPRYRRLQLGPHRCLTTPQREEPGYLRWCEDQAVLVVGWKLSSCWFG